MFSGKCFDEEVKAITILKDIVVIGGSFNYLYFHNNENDYQIDIKKKILSLSNNEDNRIFIGFESGNILILDIYIDKKNINYKIIKEFYSDQDRVDCLLYVNKFDALYSGCIENRAIQMWTKNGNYIISLDEEYKSFPALLSYSKNKDYLYSAHRENGITVWNAETAKFKKYIISRKIVSMESYDDKLFTCSNDGLICIKDEIDFCSKVRFEIEFNLYSMTIINNNIVVGTEGGILKFYDMEGRHEKDKVIHQARINVLKSKDNYIYSGSLDNCFTSLHI